MVTNLYAFYKRNMIFVDLIYIVAVVVRRNILQSRFIGGLLKPTGCARETGFPRNGHISNCAEWEFFETARMLTRGMVCWIAMMTMDRPVGGEECSQQQGGRWIEWKMMVMVKSWWDNLRYERGAEGVNSYTRWIAGEYH